MLERLTAADYQGLLQRLLPEGPIWSRGPVGALAGLLLAFGDEFTLTHDTLVDLTDEADPRSATSTLADWMRLVGVPNDCITDIPATDAEKQKLAHSIYIATGGQRADYYVEVASALGVTITVTEWPNGKPFRCGVGRCGDRLNNLSAAFQWKVTAPAATAADVRTRLECIINQRKPAHTTVTYAYTA